MTTMTMNVSASPPGVSSSSVDVELQDLATLVAGARAVSAALRLVASPHRALRQVSRQWIEQYGEEASRVLASLLSRPVNLEDLARGGYAAEEPPLLAWESDLLRGVFETRADVLTRKELAVLAKTLGFEGQPLPLGEVGASMGLTRERVRQIEAAALSKVRLFLPKGLHKTAAGRCRRSRMALAATCGPAAETAAAADAVHAADAAAAANGPPM